ncbi:hypothetical protein RISK_004414 [Rhodopirellula islandica]|uniref:Uncharacterized protein n=1 Tax=Rhodopirellula islandica TaxID=595434 RepID=A0A0J1B9W4_RHOIS|nr:hypothetical protein [Rhodopirellula islandica]KLU03517.1 hypothetical protein RISK_004414 [Rhodopirellula islandica]
MTEPMSQIGKWMVAGLLLTALVGCGSSETELLPLDAADDEQASVEEIMGGANATATERPTE